MLRRRRGLSDVEVADASRQLRAVLAPLLSECVTVGLYAAAGGELNVDQLAVATTARCAWPIAITTNSELRFVELTRAPTAAGAWGIREPGAADGPLLAPQEFDAVVVPGVAFTPTGARLGMGKGFYDRFLPQLRQDAMRIGVCYSWSLLDSIPVDEHDVYMTHVVTEVEAWRVADGVRITH